MKYQDKNTFKITLMYFVILFFGIICTPTAHAQNQNYSFVTQWSDPTLNNQPNGIAVDSSGNVYTTDTTNGLINKFNNTGTLITAFKPVITKIDQYGNSYQLPCYPLSIAIDSLGNMCVENYLNKSIEKFDSSGIYISSILYPKNVVLDLLGLAVDSSDNLFASDGDSAVYKFDKNGNCIGFWFVRCPGAPAGQVGPGAFPAGLAVDSSDNVYVAGWFSGQIMKFDNNGNLLTEWNAYSPTEINHPNDPWGLAINKSSGDVFVTDSHTNIIHKFDQNGNLLTEWKVSINAINTIDSANGPFGIAVNSSSGNIQNSPGNVYVGDSGNNQVGNSGEIYVADAHDHLVDKFAPGYTGFLPNPNGYQFTNFDSGPNSHSWTEFTNIYKLGSLPEIINPNPFGSLFAPLAYLQSKYVFYHYLFEDMSNGGNCFGMDATSLLLYNNNINDPYDQVSDSSQKVPNNWLPVQQPISSSPKDVASWISLYQPLQNTLACENDRSTTKDPRIIYNTLNANLPGLTNMVLGLYTQNGPNRIWGHALVPYDITSSTDLSTGDPLAIISVYDPNMPGNLNQKVTIDIKKWTVQPYSGTYADGTPYTKPELHLYLTSLDSITKTPEIPQWYTIVNMIFNNYVAHACYTDASGNKLGYDQGVFKDEIPGTCPMIPANDNRNNNNSTESYYVPDPSIKMELNGNGSGVSEVGMGTPNGLIIANVSVSPNSVDEFKILNNGTGVYFNSENDTTQSLDLMLDVETPNNAQIVNTSLSQIEKGGYINLSNNNGTIIIQNNGLQRTGNFTIEQMTSGQNSSINLTNIVIEANSTVNIVPSNWNDIANSTVTISDVGSDGTIYYTETIGPKNDPVITIPITPAGILNNVIYVHPGKPAEFLNNVIDVPQIHSRNSEHDNDRHYASYDSDIVPVRTLIDSEPIPMMYSSPMSNTMYSNPMYDKIPGGYGSEPYGYISEPYGTIKTPNSESYGHKAKAHLSKHKHKNHLKHHKAGKNQSEKRIIR